MDFDQVATAWSRWWRLFERGAATLSERMVDLAGIAPGDVVLDVATGLGEPALRAAKRAGPNGRVIGIDVSPAMLTLARERARAEGILNATFVEADAGRFAGSDLYDAILSRWGLMFLPDLPAALGSLRVQMKKHGRFVAAVWGAPEDVPVISLASRIAAQKFGQQPSPLAGGPFALHDTAALGLQFQACGFADVQVEEIVLVFTFDSAAQYVEYIGEVAPPVIMVMERLSEAQREELRAAIEASVALSFSTAAGIQIPSKAFIISAARTADTTSL